MSDPTHDEDADMELIRAHCDAYQASGGKTSPPDEFYDAVHRNDEVLRRTARRFKKDGADEPLMPPATLRFCASYLLSN